MCGSDGLSSSSSLLICGKSCRCQAENPLNALPSFTRPALATINAHPYRGVYALYVQGSQPNIVTGIINRQGSSLSFVPLVGGIELQGHPSEFTWFYGHYLP